MDKKKLIIIVLAVICVALLICCICLAKGKGEKKLVEVVSSFDGLEDEYGENMYFVEIKNVSGKDIHTVYPVVTFYNEKGVPTHLDTTGEIGFLGAGETRVLEIYGTSSGEKTFKVDLVDVSDKKPADLRSSLKVETKEGTYVDELDGIQTKKLEFTAKNSSDKDIVALFQLEYRTADGKLVYEDEFIEVAKAKAEISGYELIATTYDDGVTPLPEGTTYKLILAEAIEYVD